MDKKVSLLGLMLVLVLSIGCSSRSERIIVFHAGSLAVPFKQMEKEFEKLYPEVDVQLEASGSRLCARKVTELHRASDILALADYTVIRDLLMPAHVDWYVKFATNEMVIMYRPKSSFAREINAQNWPEVLLREGVSYGHSDPDRDPCGYRSQLVWQLAEKYYKRSGLYEKLRKNCPRKNIRPKETDLLALLEAGELDYLFIYRSVAEQHRMPYVILPEQINLKTSKYAHFYKLTSIKVTGKRPGEFITKEGEPMIYGVAVPKNAPHPAWAIKFVEFLLGSQGQKILAKSGQPPIVPPEASQKLKLPKKLQRLVK